jgi:hypothetical protein
MTKSKWIAIIPITILSATPAFAARPSTAFGGDGQMILSAERLFGVTFSKVREEDGDGSGTQTTSRTNVALFWPPLSLLTSPYEIPRLAFDVVAASGLTLGGSVGFISGTGTTKSEPANGAIGSERDDPTITVLAIAPRLGFALPLSARFAFWPRAGVTYYSFKSESTGAGVNRTTTKTTSNGLGLDLEPIFVFSPVSNFGITIGPIVDFPLSGSRSTERTPLGQQPAPADDKLKFTNYGGTVGLLGYF